jgi:hypothetical protein
MSEIIFVVEEAKDASFRASATEQASPTEADSLNDLHQEIRDAVHCHFDEGQVPQVFGRIRVEIDFALTGGIGLNRSLMTKVSPFDCGRFAQDTSARFGQALPP